MADREDNFQDLEIGRFVEICTAAVADVRLQAPPNILEQVRLGNLDLFRTELESGKHPLDFKAGRGQFFNRSPLHLAAMEGHEEIVEFILSCPQISREVVNAKDSFGYTPLHLAIRHSHENIVKLLTTSLLVLPDRFLTATSEPDDLGELYGGFTPLHLAAVSGHIDIAKLLLRQPCQVEFTHDPVNIFAMTWRHLTPLDLARQNKFHDLEDFLEASDLNWLQQERVRTATSANAILVGAALVAAAAFSSWLQPPGDTSNSTYEAPSPSLFASSSSSTSFYQDANSRFYVCVTCAFSFSLVSLVIGILATFPDTSASMKVNLRMLRWGLNLARRCLLVALVFLIFAYAAVSTLVFDKVASRNKFVRAAEVSLPGVTTGVILIYYRYWTNKE